MMQGPSSYNVVTTIQVIAGQPDTGVFIYKGSPGRGSLIAAAVGAAGTDPSGGNTVAPVLAVGQWSASTGLPGGQSMVDQFGNLTVQGTDGQPRLKIWTGADGVVHHNSGAVWWLNDFGAVIQIIDPTIGATVQYRDNGSAVQGGILGSQVAGTADVIDPITGAVMHPGITLIDPIFGDNLSIQGDVVGFDQVAMTRKCFISSQDPSAPNALGPFLQVDAPEHTQALHWQGIYLGKSSDGTVPPKAIFCTQSGNGVSPVVNTNDFLELQPISGQNAIQAFMQLVTDRALNTRVTGDTVDRFTIGADGTHNWGPGNAATDVTLSRPSTVGFLRVTGGLQITNLLELFNQVAGTTVLEFVVGTETTARFQSDNIGKMQWGPGGGSAVDTDLFRAGAHILQSDGAIHLNGASSGNEFLAFGAAAATLAFRANVASDTNDRYNVDNTGKISWGPGNAATDTTLNRNASKSLATNGMFTAGDLAVGNNNQGALATNGTINTYTTTGVGSTTVVPAAAVTGIILQAGTVAGQVYWVLNNSANLITFAASGSNVSNGSNVTIPGRAAAGFIWDGVSQWYKF